MSDYRRLSIFAVLVGLCCSLTAVRADECRKVVVSADPEFPPYAWYDGKTLRGASVDVVLTVLRSMGLPYELTYEGPFARLLLTARRGGVDIITELKRNSEREVYLAFTETAIFTNPTSVFVRAGASIGDFHGRDDLRKRHGGVTRSTRFGDGLDEFIKDVLEVEEGPGIHENFAKLEARRIDYFISPHYPAMTYLITSGQEGRFTALKPFVAVAPVYVGWSKQSPCLSRLPEFDAKLKRYVAAMDAWRVMQASYADWRKEPVMVR
jgi:polar amino acid transport system substrate-binding protein